MNYTIKTTGLEDLRDQLADELERAAGVEESHAGIYSAKTARTLCEARGAVLRETADRFRAIIVTSDEPPTIKQVTVLDALLDHFNWYNPPEPDPFMDEDALIKVSWDGHSWTGDGRPEFKFDGGNRRGWAQRPNGSITNGEDEIYVSVTGSQSGRIYWVCVLHRCDSPPTILAGTDALLASAYPLNDQAKGLVAAVNRLINKLG